MYSKYSKYFVLLIYVSLFGCESSDRSAKNPAPIPDIAKGPQIPSEKGYLIEKIGEDLYWLTNGVYQAMFFVTEKGVVAVDAPPSIGINYLKAIEEVTDKKITHIIYSHPHADHISAASMFPSDAVYITHEETAAKLISRKNSNRKYEFGHFSGGSSVPLPTITFLDNYTLKVGTQIIELSYAGINHEPGIIFIYAPMQKVLMFVDVIDPGWIPFKRLAHADNTIGFITAYDKVMSFDFDMFIGGHLNRFGTRGDIMLHGEYMRDLEESAIEALESITFSSVAKKVGYSNTFLLFGSYIDAVSDEYEKLMLPKWIGRLGGADIFTIDNCSQMISSLRLE